MANTQPLLAAGPFEGLNNSASPFYQPKGSGHTAQNADISYRMGALSTAAGRDFIASFKIASTGYKLQCVAPFSSFFGGDTNGEGIGTTTAYVFSSIIPGASTSQQGWLNPATGGFTILPGVNPFTQAVQFGSELFTNGGDRLFFTNDGKLTVADWQIQILPEYSYNIGINEATWPGTSPGITSQQYQYAVTWRSSGAWTTAPGPTKYGEPTTLYMPDLDTYQESSPVFSGFWDLNATGSNAGAVGVLSPLGSADLTALAHGVRNGQTYYGALYRASELNPTFVMVDYLINLPTSTYVNPVGGATVPCFVDPYQDSDIINNVIMTTHNDPPPIVGQVYPGPNLTALTSSGGKPINNTPNSAGIQEQQKAQIQRAFQYINPAYITKHKDRMFAFTLYPTQPVQYTPSGSVSNLYQNRLTLQPQLWFSDYGEPGSFDDVNQLLLVGPEDTAGNYSIVRHNGTTSLTTVPWRPDLACDTPKGIASTGSILVIFKSATTWVCYGESPAEFLQGLRKAFDLGCQSTNSITEAEGGVFWQAPQGVYFFDGAAPSYISEDIRGALEMFPITELQNSSGAYSNRTYYLTFAPSNVAASPAFKTGVTYCYYTPTQKWYSLPYGGPCTFQMQPDLNQAGIVTPNPSNPEFFNISTIAGSVLDLGAPVTAVWETGLTDVGSPGVIKQCTTLVVQAPPQPGATLTASLSVDRDTVVEPFVKKWDLSVNTGGNGWVTTIPDAYNGYNLQLTLSLTASSGGERAFIWSAAVLGTAKYGPFSTATNDGTLDNVAP